MTFEPSWPLRHPNVQSVLASFKPRNWALRMHQAILAAREYVLDCGDGIRLMGLHSPQSEGRQPKGLAILIHGWEGSHDSAYLVSLACTLHNAGYGVFRLNLRDHGRTHALNEGVFHSGRLQEVLGAIAAIKRIDSARPMFVVGYSLGGNFALRIGLSRAPQSVSPDLSVGICPAINPGKALAALDNGPKIFHRYFMRKMRRSLELKGAAWPLQYDFSELMAQSSFVQVTRLFAEVYTEYGSLERYLESYTLTCEMFNAASSSIAIIAAADDPVVPFIDFSRLENRNGVRFIPTRYGGHCGFLDGISLNNWAEYQVLALFEEFT